MKEIEEDSKKEIKEEFNIKDLSEKIEEENSFEIKKDKDIIQTEDFEETNEFFDNLINEDL